MQIPLARVVAVVATLPDGREQVGSGYLVGGRLVLTARHCTRDKSRSRPVPLDQLRVVRASDSASTAVSEVVAASTLDIAVLRLVDPPWRSGLAAPAYSRVDRTVSGRVTDCAGIGFPLFQRDPAAKVRHTAEVHGTIYQTDLAEIGRLLLREPLLAAVHVATENIDHELELTCTDPAYDEDDRETAWDGLSGALVFQAGYALGVVVDHDTRQGPAALQLVAFDTLAKQARTDKSAAAVAEALGLPAVERLPWASTQPAEPLAGLVEVVDPASGDLPRVCDLDPYRLGTTPSDYGDQDTYGMRDPYVPRTCNNVDERLRTALKPGRPVLVVGPSKVGKTRTAFEAVAADWAQARVAAAAVGHLERLARHSRLQTSIDPIVVWLDDVDRYLTTVEPLTPTVLTRLSARPGPTLVVGTLRREARDRLRAAAGELTRDARALLEGAIIVELGSTIDDRDEEATARAAYPEQPLEGAGLAERLGYAPLMLQTYHDSATADPLLHAVIRTAVDWSRTGLSRPISETDLANITAEVVWREHPHLDGTDDAFDRAIRQARTPLPGSTGAAALITHPLAGRRRGYTAYDYLVAADDGQTGQPRPLPDLAWDDALIRADRDDAFAIGVAAYAREDIAASIRALQQAAAAGHALAAYNLGVILCGALAPANRKAAARLQVPPDLPAARAWWEQAAAAGQIEADFNLGVLLSENWNPPDLPAARTAYERAAAAGSTKAAYNLGLLLKGDWEPPDLTAAHTAFRQAAASGHVNANWEAVLLRKLFDDARAAGRPSADLFAERRAAEEENLRRYTAEVVAQKHTDELREFLEWTRRVPEPRRSRVDVRGIYADELAKRDGRGSENE